LPGRALRRGSGRLSQKAISGHSRTPKSHESSCVCPPQRAPRDGAGEVHISLTTTPPPPLSGGRWNQRTQAGLFSSLAGLASSTAHLRTWSGLTFPLFPKDRHWKCRVGTRRLFPIEWARRHPRHNVLGVELLPGAYPQARSASLRPCLLIGAHPAGSPPICSNTSSAPLGPSAPHLFS